MIHLIPIPIIMTAFIVKLVCTRYKVKTLNSISTVVIVIGVIAFIYTYTQYIGFDIFEYITDFLF